MQCIWQILLAKLTKNILRGINFTNLKTSGGYIAKSKPRRSVCNWTKPEEVIMQFDLVNMNVNSFRSRNGLIGEAKNIWSERFFENVKGCWELAKKKGKRLLRDKCKDEESVTMTSFWPQMRPPIKVCCLKKKEKNLNRFFNSNLIYELSENSFFFPEI